jgi:hypothetical protein
MCTGAKSLLQVSSPCKITGVEACLLFTAVFLHELAHCSLVWYGCGSCDSPKLGGIEEEAGEFFERAIFGGISGCEIDKEELQIKTVGFFKGRLYYPISKSYHPLL